jgi:hypothetical protein
MTLTQTPPVDSDRLDQFLGRFVNDLGATIAAGSVLVGDGSASTGHWPTGP